MSELRPSRGIEFFEDIRRFLSSALGEYERLSERDREEITRVVEQQVVEFWGGLQIYVPRAALELAIRNKQIYQEYNGINLADLARKFQLTETSLRKIINASRGVKKAAETAQPERPEEAVQQQLGF